MTAEEIVLAELNRRENETGSKRHTVSIHITRGHGKFSEEAVAAEVLASFSRQPWDRSSVAPMPKQASRPVADWLADIL